MRLHWLAERVLTSARALKQLGITGRACRAKMVKQCRGVTRAGKRCSINSASQLTNESGRSAAEPLRRGGDFCLFHTKTFCTTEVEARSDSQLVIILLDLETTGVAHSAWLHDYR